MTLIQQPAFVLFEAKDEEKTKSTRKKWMGVIKSFLVSFEQASAAEPFFEGSTSSSAIVARSVLSQQQ